LSPFKLLALDWNGCVLDDRIFHYESVKFILARYGLRSPSLTKYFREFEKIGWKEFYYHYGVPRTESLGTLNEIRREFMKKNWTTSVLRPEIWGLFACCFAYKIHRVLVTQEIPELVSGQLEKSGIQRYFEICFTGLKNKKGPLAEAIQHFGVSPHETLFVDDMPQCITEAKELGVYTVGMTKGFTSKRGIARAKPDVMIESLEEATSLLRNSHLENT